MKITLTYLIIILSVISIKAQSTNDDMEEYLKTTHFFEGASFRLLNENMFKSEKSLTLAFNPIFIGIEKDYSRFYKLCYELKPFKFQWTSYGKGEVNSIEYDDITLFSYNVDFSVYNRFILDTNSEYTYHHTYLDIGVGYNVPAVYRLRLKDDENINVSKAEHSFQDFYLMGRINFGMVGIALEYHFIDSFEDTRVPNPYKFLMGIDIKFNN